MTRDFPLGAILSITDGHLVARNHIDGVYEILNWSKTIIPIVIREEET